MKTLFAKIAAIIANMSRFVWKTVIVAGKTIHSLVSVAPDPLPNPSITEEVEPDNIERIKMLAAIIVSGRAPTKEEVEGISVEITDWLRQLDRHELSVIAMSPKLRLEDHLAGRIKMSKVPAFSRQSDKLTEMMVINATPAKVKRKTLREALEVKGRGIAS